MTRETKKAWNTIGKSIIDTTKSIPKKTTQEVELIGRWFKQVGRAITINPDKHLVCTVKRPQLKTKEN